MNKSYVLPTFLTAVMCLFLSNLSNASEWIASEDAQSCDMTCGAQNSTPVISGIFAPNGNPFYVCRGDVNETEGGGRAGYNLRPDLSSACTVGFNQMEVAVEPFDCLCDEKPVPIIKIVDIASAPTPPSGSKLACMIGPNSPTPDDRATSCPVIQYGELTFWFFSFNNNDFAVNVVGYDASNNMVSQKRYDGGRYIWAVTVDESNQEVITYNQHGDTVRIPWNDFYLSLSDFRD
ncbi:hypothetical protein [Marinomonas transparens]|uniref:Secreted protein n=1 Tax=Marinomonas transparens TaxID=2795388 RepID=A0A934MUY9_9GAMM|nr:hypothetical protein [Marinomonas transparens]MBJ7536454.1 hypothetical protein [Marinomonas transparens]